MSERRQDERKLKKKERLKKEPKRKKSERRQKNGVVSTTIITAGVVHSVAQLPKATIQPIPIQRMNLRKNKKLKIQLSGKSLYLKKQKHWVFIILIFNYMSLLFVCLSFVYQ